jgi:hypothetical protein
MQALVAEYCEHINARATTPLGAHGDCILVTHIDLVEVGVTTAVLPASLVPCAVWAALVSGAYSTLRFSLNPNVEAPWANESAETKIVHAWLRACFTCTRLQEYDDTGFHFLPATKPVYHMFLYS